MKKKIQLSLITTVSIISTLATATDMGEVMPLPPLPSRILQPDEPAYSADCRRKANESYRILQVDENPAPETLTKGVRLLIEAVEEGNPYSLKRLADIALYGRYNIKKNVEWAIDAFIYLIDNGFAEAWNALGAIDQSAVSLLEAGKKEEARDLFVKTGNETR